MYITNHCLTSPSSSDRWLACSGSLELEQLYPQERKPTPAMEYGSKVHELAEQLFNSKDPSIFIQHARRKGEDENALREAEGFVNYVQGIKLNDPVVAIEGRVMMLSITSELYGTPDVILYNDQELHVIDLKTGATYVSAVNNTQLMLYAIGAVDTYHLEPQSITLHIYQNNERAGDATSTYTLSKAKLDEFRDLVQYRMDFIQRGIYRYAPGKPCRYCPVKDKCTAYATQVASTYHTHTGTIVSLSELTPAQKVAMIRDIKLLNQAMDILQDQLLHESPETLHPLGVEIKTKKQPEKYTNSDDALALLTSEGYDQDIIAPRSLLSPAKLKKAQPEAYQTLHDHESITRGNDTQYLCYNDKPKEPI